MAADRSRLIPTPITDRAGKKTTVYRRPAAGSKPSAMLPAPVASGAGPSGLDRLKGIFAEMSRGEYMGMKRLTFIEQCTEQQARILTDVCEAHPGFIEILRAETTVHAMARYEARGDQSEATAIARVYEDGAVEVPDGDGPVARAHAYHRKYAFAVVCVCMAARRLGLPAADPFADDFDPRHLAAVREAVRFDARRRESPVSITSRAYEEVLDAVIRGECTAAGIEAAICDHGATSAQQIIGLAKGITPAVSDGWL